MEAGKSQNKIKAYLLCSENEGVPVYPPPPPAFPVFRAVLNWAMWMGGRIVMRRPMPPNPRLSLIPPPLKSPVFIFHSFGLPVPICSGPVRLLSHKMITKFHFFIFPFPPKSLEPACTMALPYPTQITRNNNLA